MGGLGVYSFHSFLCICNILVLGDFVMPVNKPYREGSSRSCFFVFVFFFFSSGTPPTPHFFFFFGLYD